MADLLGLARLAAKLAWKSRQQTAPFHLVDESLHEDESLREGPIGFWRLGIAPSVQPLEYGQHARKLVDPGIADLIPFKLLTESHASSRQQLRRV